MTKDDTASANLGKGATAQEREALMAEALSSAAGRYIAGCEARVEDFVREHYSLRGSLRLHRHALGWDILRVPLNILWTLIRLLLVVVGLILASFGLSFFRRWAEHLP